MLWWTKITQWYLFIIDLLSCNLLFKLSLCHSSLWWSHWHRSHTLFFILYETSPKPIETGRVCIHYKYGVADWEHGWGQVRYWGRGVFFGCKRSVNGEKQDNGGPWTFECSAEQCYMCLNFVTRFIRSNGGRNRNHAMRKNTHFFLMNESSHH